MPATDGGTPAGAMTIVAEVPGGTGTGVAPEVGGKVGGGVAPMGGAPKAQVRLNFAPVPEPVVETCATGLGGSASKLALPPLVTDTEAILLPVMVVALRTTPLVRATLSLRA